MNKRGILFILVVSILTLISLDFVSAAGYLPVNISSYILHNESDTQYNLYSQMKNVSSDLAVISSEAAQLVNNVPVCWNTKWLTSNQSLPYLVNGTWIFKIYTNCSSSFSNSQYYLLAKIIKRNSTAEYNFENSSWSGFACASGATSLKNWTYNLSYSNNFNLTSDERIGVQICVKVTGGGATNKYGYSFWEGTTDSNVLFPITLFDNINPQINYNSGTETSGSTITRANIIVNVSASDLNLVNITINLFNSTSLINRTTTTSSNLFINFTNIIDGIYYFNSTAYDIVGNYNSTPTRNVTIQLDKTSPSLAIVYPANTSYNAIISSLNYTVSDDNLQACWYSLNNGQTNITITCGQNISGLTANQGSNIWTVWANDSFGNKNSSSVTFFIDSISPSISIFSPQNITYTINSIFLNYSASDVNGINSCWYSLDSSPNISLSGCSTATISGLTDGTHQLSIYANDSYGNINSTYVYFSVSSMPPQWSSMQNYTPSYYSSTNLSLFNITWTSLNTVQSVLFESNFSGSSQNYSMYLISGNVYGFNATLSAGTFYWKSHANDTYGNSNTSSTQIFSIQKASSNIILYLNGNTSNITFSYGTQINISGIENNLGDGDINYKLYRNNLEVSNPDFSALASGSYTYIYNSTEGQNYSSNSVNNEITITKTNPVIYLFLNNNQGNASQIYGNASSINVSSNIEGLNINLFRDNNPVSNPDISILGAGVYNYTAIYEGNENYSAESITYFLTVEKASPDLDLLLNGFNSDISLSSGEILYINASLLNPLFNNIDLYENDILISSGSPVFVQINYTSLGNRIWKVVFSGNQNYSALNISHTVSVIDSNFPHFSDLKTSPNSPISYSFNKIYQFNSTWIDDMGITEVIFQFNGINYSYSNSQLQKNTDEYFFNISSLSVGTYNYRWYANDTSGNLVSTTLQSYTINQGIAALFLTITPSNTINYGTTSTVSCSANNLESVPVLTRNMNLVLNPDQGLLSVNTYNYACVSATTQNYSSASATGILTINKADPVINLSLNNLSSDLTLSSSGGDVVIDTNLINPSEGNINLTVNGIIINSGLSPLQNISHFSTPGTYLVTVSFAGNENYSFGNLTRIITVSTPPSNNYGGGGGGGGSSGTSITNKERVIKEESIAKVEINKPQNLIINPGENKKIILSVKNTGKFLNACKLKGLGEYSSWISSETTRGLSTGEIAEFIFNLNIPDDVEPKKYNLALSLSCQEIKEPINIEAEVINKKLGIKLIDVKKENKNQIKITYSVSENSGYDQNVEIEVVLFGLSSERIAENKETKNILANSEQIFESILDTPSSISGNFNLLINANSDISSSFIQESIILGNSPIGALAIFLSGSGQNTFIGASIVIIFLIFVFFTIRRILKYRVISQQKGYQKVSVE